MARPDIQAYPTVRIEEDFHEWLLDQAAALRARRFTSLDCENLAEELEAMAAKERREIKSHLRKLLLHLLKFQAQPAELNRHHSWRSSIDEARAEIEDIVADSPGVFQGKRDEFVAQSFARARRTASNETQLPIADFPERCPWSFGQIMDEDFFPRISRDAR